VYLVIIFAQAGIAGFQYGDAVIQPVGSRAHHVVEHFSVMRELGFQLLAICQS
jgi:hypothetical protein